MNYLFCLGCFLSKVYLIVLIFAISVLSRFLRLLSDVKHSYSKGTYITSTTSMFVPFLLIFQSLLHQLAVWSGSSRLVIIVAIATVFRVQSIISLSGIQFCFLVLFFSHAKFEWLFTEESQLLQPCFSRQEEKKSHLLNMTHARSIIVYTAVLIFWLLWFRE